MSAALAPRAAAAASRWASPSASLVVPCSGGGGSNVGSIASFSSDSIPPPNRMTAAFNEIKRTCPDEMQAYADCVVRGHKDGHLEKGACQAEFDLVKACFRTARGRR